MTENRLRDVFADLDAAPAEPSREFVARLRERIHDVATGTAGTSIDPSDPAIGEPIMVTLETEPRTTSDDRRPNRRRGAWLAVAAVVLAAVGAGAAIVYALQDDDPEPTMTATAPALSEGQAVVVVNEYFEAYDDGDLQRLLSMLTDNATYSDIAQPITDRPVWDAQLAWELAVETRITSRTCRAVGSRLGSDTEPGAEAVTVSCSYQAQSAEARAAGQTILYTTELTVVQGGIRSVRADWGNSEFSPADIGQPFVAWLEQNHPEAVETAGALWGATIEESTTNGEARVTYAALWGEHLEEKGCTRFDLDC